MVLRLKAWESKSLPGFLNTIYQINKFSSCKFNHSAGWSSPVARQAHNLKVAGSNPAPATNYFTLLQLISRLEFEAAFCFVNYCRVLLVRNVG